jgi:RNA polymerase-binding transcription factor DksA
MSPDPTATKEAFDAAAKANGWKCARCGKKISFEDKEAFTSANLCAACHDAIDAESGPIPTL